MNNEYERQKPSQAILVEGKSSQGTESISRRFTDTFIIGSSKQSDLQIDNPSVSNYHTQILCDRKGWWIRDLLSANGTYLNGAQIQNVALPDKAEIELGKGGPVLLLSIDKEKSPVAEGEKKTDKTEKFSSETQIIKRYLEKSKEESGEQTMMFKRAFERVHRKKSTKYYVMIGIAIFFLITASGVIIYQKHKISKMRETAENIFYSMKTLEVQVGQLEEYVLKSANKDLIRDLQLKRQKIREMEKQYDTFVDELGIYDGLSKKEQIIFKLARTFGECEVNMPEGFVREVNNYIRKWQNSDRLRTAITIAKEKNFAPFISRVMTENNVPPRFFYLALQESSFNDKAIGPKTRYGYAKGMWQFIAPTAQRFGLQLGPRQKQGIYDPLDDRFDFIKATHAAARYIRDINNTDAQASGLLVMASYNWGENNILDIIRRMPGNPRERNFWRLLATAKIPRETYDYVFYIFSAAVICENPHLFGFDFDCPCLK